MNIYLSVSGAPHDRKLYADLVKQRATVTRAGHCIWSAIAIQPGPEESSARAQMLAEADVILLLLSPDYQAAKRATGRAHQAASAMQGQLGFRCAQSVPNATESLKSGQRE